MSWPNLELHHGHRTPVTGCKACYWAGKEGWVCACGCVNIKHDVPAEDLVKDAACRNCGNTIAETRRACRCGHARNKHNEMSGKCTGKDCKCGEFEHKSIPKAKGAVRL